MIKLIMFDFDGVIDGNYELHFELSGKKFLDITREEHRKLFEGNIHIEREKLKHRDTGFDFLKHLSDTRKTRKIKKDVEETLLHLSKDYTLGIVSSSHEYGIKDYLEGNEIEDLFSFTYGYETHKLKIHKFEKVLNEFNLKKEECVFITDTLGDILEANEIGIKTVAVDFGYHERERLEKGNPMRIISNFSELVEVMRNIV